MNVDQGVAHSFYKGKPGCGISDALEPENRAEAQVQENLYLATLNNGANDKLVKVLPTRFNHLMPRLKASDYDYIIFDMPPVTQTSATPRLASYMDLALLVLESEKTSQHSADSGERADARGAGQCGGGPEQTPLPHAGVAVPGVIGDLGGFGGCIGCAERG